MAKGKLLMKAIRAKVNRCDGVLEASVCTEKCISRFLLLLLCLIIFFFYEKCN